VGDGPRNTVPKAGFGAPAAGGRCLAGSGGALAAAAARSAAARSRRFSRDRWMLSFTQAAQDNERPSFFRLSA
jgi:hypothetical protein